MRLELRQDLGPFTTYCLLCTYQIPEDRQRKCSVTCSTNCQKALRLGRLRDRRQRFCKACGNKVPKKRQKTNGSSAPEHAERNLQ